MRVPALLSALLHVMVVAFIWFGLPEFFRPRIEIEDPVLRHSDVAIKVSLLDTISSNTAGR